MKVQEALTPGAAKALGKLDAARHRPCSVCGFALPKYPGRYPKACPGCDTPMADAVQGDEEADP